MAVTRVDRLRLEHERAGVVPGPAGLTALVPPALLYPEKFEDLWYQACRDDQAWEECKGRERREAVARRQGLGLRVDGPAMEWAAQPGRRPVHAVPCEDAAPELDHEGLARAEQRWRRLRVARRLDPPALRYQRALPKVSPKAKPIPREPLIDQVTGQQVVATSVRARCGFLATPEQDPHGFAPKAVRAWRESGKVVLKGPQSCKSGFACPRCGPKKRAAKGLELEQGLANFWQQYPQGTAVLVTVTIRHGRVDPLADTMRAVQDAWAKGVCSGNSWKHAKKRLGYFGMVRTIEVTYGQAGWHPHIHGLLLFEKSLNDMELYDLHQVVYRSWAGRLVAQHGQEAPSQQRGVHVQRVTSGAGGAYLVKEGGQPRSLSLEMTRADLKRGRAGQSVTPFELLDQFAAAERAKDAAGMARTKGLWNEYVAATKGYAVLRWPPDLKAKLGVEKVDPQDQTEVDALADDPDGQPDGLLQELDRGQWRALNLVHDGAGPGHWLWLLGQGLYVSAVRYVAAAVVEVARRDREQQQRARLRDAARASPVERGLLAVFPGSEEV